MSSSASSAALTRVLLPGRVQASAIPGRSAVAREQREESRRGRGVEEVSLGAARRRTPSVTFNVDALTGVLHSPELGRRAPRAAALRPLRWLLTKRQVWAER